MASMPTWPGLAGLIAQGVARSERGAGLAVHREELRRAASPLEWIDLLIRAGVPSDGNSQLTFRGREFWRPIYAAIRDRRAVVKSAAQVGKSIMMFYAIAALAHLDHYEGHGGWIGMYLPTQDMTRLFSQGRLSNILTAIGRVTGVPCGDTGTDDARAGFDASTVRVLDQVLAQLAESDDSDGWQEYADQVTSASLDAMANAAIKDDLADAARAKRKDSYNLKQIAESFILLGWIGGMGVDAFPLRRLLLDEVRLMSPARVARVEKRIMGSNLKGGGSILWTSTAGMPGDAIDVRWAGSTQAHFHHDCQCPDGVELNKVWPNCLGVKPGEPDPSRRYFLYCPRCGAKVTDRSAGRWIEHYPESGTYRGWNPHQLMTEQPLEAIVEAWEMPGNRGEFYRSNLGLEFLDPDAIPITRDVIRSCENADLVWAQPGDVSNACMGIDHGGGYNHFVIGHRARNGKHRRAHVEATWDDDPFQRAAQLMRDYDVSIALIEPLPNWVSARKFAAAFPGRVWICDWLTSKQPKPRDPVQWLDRPATDEERKAAAETRWKYTVRVHRNTALEMMTEAWRDRAIECPPGLTLNGRIVDDHGNEQIVCVGEDLYFDHLQRLARRTVSEALQADGVEVKEETGVKRVHWVKLAKAPGTVRRPANVAGNAADPHFAFAETLCGIAFTRLPHHKRRIRVHM